MSLSKRRNEILVEYTGPLQHHQGDVRNVLREQIICVNGQKFDSAVPVQMAPGDSVEVRSGKMNSRSGRSCTWEGCILEVTIKQSKSEEPKTQDKKKTGRTTTSPSIQILKCIDSVEDYSPGIPDCPTFNSPNQQPNYDSNQMNDEFTVLDQHLAKFAEKLTKNLQGHIAEILKPVHSKISTLDEKIESLASHHHLLYQPQQSTILQKAHQSFSDGNFMSGEDVESVFSSIYEESCDRNSYTSLPLPPPIHNVKPSPSIPPLSTIPILSPPLSDNLMSPPLSDNLMCPPQTLPILDSTTSSIPPAPPSFYSDVPASGSSSGSTCTSKLLSTNAGSMREKRRVEIWVENGFLEHLTIEQIIIKNDFHKPSASWAEWCKLGLQIVKHNVFGERTLSLSSLGGRDLRLLEPIKVSFLKDTLRQYAPQNCSQEVEFEKNWSELRGKINQMCKRLRHLLDKYSLKRKAEELTLLYT